LSPIKIARWAQVTLTPEDNKIAVLSKGIPIGHNGVIPLGGQQQPIQIEGDNAEWKKAQNNETKNIVSVNINNMNPSFIPADT